MAWLACNSPEVIFSAESPRVLTAGSGLFLLRLHLILLFQQQRQIDTCLWRSIFCHPINTRLPLSLLTPSDLSWSTHFPFPIYISGFWVFLLVRKRCKKNQSENQNPTKSPTVQQYGPTYSRCECRIAARAASCHQPFFWSDQSSDLDGRRSGQGVSPDLTHAEFSIHRLDSEWVVCSF